MKHFFVSPHPSVAAYVQNILVIEDYRVNRPFMMPLFANATPTLLFQTARASINNKPSGNLVLFGQAVTPGTLALQKSFTLIAYFLKPHTLLSLFDVQGSELAD